MKTALTNEELGMVVRRIIIGSAAEYEKWVRSKILLSENVCEIVNQCFHKGRRGIQLFGIHGALLFLCAALPFLISNFSFLILEKQYGDL